MLTLMATNSIILTILRNLKSITYLSLLLKFVLRSHHSGTHFPQKNLVIAQFGYGSARAWLGEKARWRIWSQDGEGGSGGGVKTSGRLDPLKKVKIEYISGLTI